MTVFSVALACLVIAFATGVAAMVFSSVYQSRMIAEIHEGSDVRIPFFAWGKFFLVRNEYSRLFPNRDLGRKLMVALGVAAASWVVTAILLFSLDYLR